MPNVVRTLTDPDAAYIAGIVDGTCKRARAELLLQRYVLVTPRNGRYTSELLAARTQLEASFFAIRSRASACAVAAGTSLPPRSLSGS